MRLYILPPMPVRYGYRCHWIEWWREELDDLGIDYVMLIPSMMLYEEMRSTSFRTSRWGYFAPVDKSIVWDALVLKTLAEKIKGMDFDSIILFLDFSYTGLAQSLIPLIKRYRPDLVLGAYAHMGSWEPINYFETVREAKFLIELGAEKLLDYLFFPTKHMKQLFLQAKALYECTGRIIKAGGKIKGKCFEEKLKEYMKSDKYVVVGSLWKPYHDIIRLSRISKKDVVLVNGAYETLDIRRLKSIVKRLSSKYVFKATDQRVAVQLGIEYINYFDGLGESKVFLQLKKHDSFGLPVVEALYVGSIPVLPDKPPYNEVFRGFTCNNRVSDYVSRILEVFETYEEYLESLPYVYDYIRHEYLNAPRKIIKTLYG